MDNIIIPDPAFKPIFRFIILKNKRKRDGYTLIKRTIWVPYWGLK